MALCVYLPLEYHFDSTAYIPGLNSQTTEIRA